MKLATWNVNSLRARCRECSSSSRPHEPDVVLLQETKVAEDQFPAQELADAGYDAVHHSGGQWAGVAILARSGLGLTEATTGLPGEARPEEARWIEAAVAGLGVRVASVYVVNGREVGSPTFDEKLRVSRRARAPRGRTARSAARRRRGLQHRAGRRGRLRPGGVRRLDARHR